MLSMSCGDNNGKATPKGAKGRLSVEGYKVIPQPFNSDVTATAELMAGEQVELMAPLSGQVLDIYFKEGSKIREGSPIMHIDDRHWKAQMVGVKAALITAQKDYERKQALLEVEGSSQEDIDKAYSTVETLKSQLQQLQVNINLANVTAPFSGQLGMRNFSKGAFLRQGDIITTITSLQQLKVNFRLAQEYKNSVGPGKKVSVIVDGDTMQASVYAINPIIDQQSRTIHVRALLQQDPDNMIMPGTFAEVLVTTDFVNEALLIPTRAVVPEINDQTVYIYKNGKAVRRAIEMGNRTADMVQVLQGVVAGDTVITTGLLEVKEGMDVQVQLFN